MFYEPQVQKEKVLKSDDEHFDEDRILKIDTVSSIVERLPGKVFALQNSVNAGPAKAVPTFT